MTTWDLPGRGLTGIPGGVLGGWRWGTITTLQSGVPFEILTGFNNSRQNILWANATTRVASAGRITRTITTSRQIQFGMRFSF